MVMVHTLILILHVLVTMIAAVSGLAIGVLELKPEGRPGAFILRTLTPHRRRITKTMLVTVCASALLAAIRGAISDKSQRELENLRTVNKLVPAAGAALTPYDLFPSSDAKKICSEIPEGATFFSDALRFVGMARYGEAETALRRAEIGQEVEPYKIFRLRGIAGVYRGNYVKALRWYLQAARANPNSLVLGDELWEVLTETGKLSAADDLLVSVISAKSRLARDENNPSIVLSKIHLADTRSQLGRYAEALSIVQKTRESQEQAEGSLSASLINTLETEANALANLDNIERAHKSFDRIREIARREYGKQSVEYAEYLNNHALLYSKVGDPDHARRLDIMAYLIAQKLLTENHYVSGDILANIGMTYNSERDFGRAEYYLRQAYSILEASLGPEHPSTAVVQMNLGRTLTELNRFADARLELRAASLKLEAAVGKGHVFYSYAEAALGVLERKEKHYQEALQHYQHSLQTDLETFGTGPHSETAVVLADIAIVENQMGHQDDAEHHIIQSLGMSESIMGQESPSLVPRLINLGTILVAQQKYSEARRELERALSIGVPALGNNNKLMEITRKKIQEIEKK